MAASLLPWAIGAAALGVVGWSLGRALGSTSGPTTPKPSGGGGPVLVYVDRTTAQRDWDAGVIAGATAGYGDGAGAKVFVATRTVDAVPRDINSPAAWRQGWACGYGPGRVLGARARELFGPAAADTEMDPVAAGPTLRRECAGGFVDWYGAHGAEPVPARVAVGVAMDDALLGHGWTRDPRTGTLIPIRYVPLRASFSRGRRP